MGSLAVLFGLAFLASTQSFGQQEGKEKSIIIEKHISDSTARHYMNTTVDPAKLRRGWGKLQRGMLEKDVEVLLGRPTGIRIDYTDNSTTWYYDRRLIIFDIINQTVREWHK